MKTKTPYTIGLILAICALLASCSNANNTYTDFLIKVDSIHCPDSVISNASFDIEFFGIIGFNGCYSFKTFNQRLADNDITIEAWGTYDSNAGICPAALVTLDGQKLSMSLFTPGLYRIKISEPDMTIIVKSIVVKKQP
jgi:hypothetical protein